jgi:hypothetical protein
MRDPFVSGVLSTILFVRRRGAAASGHPACAPIGPLDGVVIHINDQF